MKKFIAWLHNVKGGSSLPEHLSFKLHNDYIFPLNYLPRELNAFGYRSQNKMFGWRQFPILLLGYGCTRWMDKNDNEFYRAGFKGWRIFQGDERMGPSPLQKLSKCSFQITWPLHFSFHVMLGKRPFLIRKGPGRWDSHDEYYNWGINDIILAILIGLIFGWPWFVVSVIFIPDYIGFAWN